VTIELNYRLDVKGYDYALSYWVLVCIVLCAFLNGETVVCDIEHLSPFGCWLGLEALWPVAGWVQTSGTWSADARLLCQHSYRLHYSLITSIDPYQ